ncbi:hypothetical protein H1C71_038714, partial [Ictidomys tridecemlineatus]
GILQSTDNRSRTDTLPQVVTDHSLEHSPGVQIILPSGDKLHHKDMVVMTASDVTIRSTGPEYDLHSPSPNLPGDEPTGPPDRPGSMSQALPLRMGMKKYEQEGRICIIWVRESLGQVRKTWSPVRHTNPLLSKERKSAGVLMTAEKSWGEKRVGGKVDKGEEFPHYELSSKKRSVPDLISILHGS